MRSETKIKERRSNIFLSTSFKHVKIAHVWFVLRIRSVFIKTVLTICSLKIKCERRRSNTTNTIRCNDRLLQRSSAIFAGSVLKNIEYMITAQTGRWISNLEPRQQLCRLDPLHDGLNLLLFHCEHGTESNRVHLSPSVKACVNTAKYLQPQSSSVPASLRVTLKRNSRSLFRSAASIHAALDELLLISNVQTAFASL